MIKALEVIRIVSPVSQLERQAIFLQKDPIRRDLLAVSPRIDISLRVDRW